MELVILAAAALLLGGIGYLAVKSYTRRLLGPVALDVSATEVCMGDQLEYELRLSPTGRLHVNAITLECRGYEWIQWRETQHYTDSKGNSRTRTVTKTKTQTLHEDRAELAGNRPLPPGGTFAEGGVFAIPREGPPSMSADDNAIRWQLDLHIDIRGLPDFEETYAFEVKPARRRRG
jgi:hypothetical protein